MRNSLKKQFFELAAFSNSSKPLKEKRCRNTEPIRGCTPKGEIKLSKKKVILIFTLFLLVTTVVALPRPVAAQDSKTIVITSAYGIGTKAVSNLTTWLVGLGHTVINAAGGINSSILVGASSA